LDQVSDGRVLRKTQHSSGWELDGSIAAWFPGKSGFRTGLVNRQSRLSPKGHDLPDAAGSGSQCRAAASEEQIGRKSARSGDTGNHQTFHGSDL